MTFYVNILEEAQIKSLSTDLPLSKSTIIATATKSVFASQEYTDQYREWECDLKDTKTWAAWKLEYKRAFELQQLAHQASDGEIQFDSANAAMGARPSALRHSNPSAGESLEYKKLEG